MKIKETKYAITTESGYIPFITDFNQDYICLPRKVYLDDFLYKNSFYNKGNICTLKKFIGCEMQVILCCKKKPSLLVSKRGNYILKEEEYNKAIEILEPDFAFNFKDGNIDIEGKKFYEPKDINDFNECFNKSNLILGTEWLNQIIEKNELIFIEKEKLISKHLNETNLEYEKYLLSIKEMNASTFVAEFNYKRLYEFFYSKNN